MEVAAVSEASVALAAEALAHGQAVVIPTDTVYGLAVAARRQGAVEQLFALKERPHGVAVAVLLADMDQADELAELSDGARRLGRRFWPGALTIVARRREGLDLDLDLGGDPATVGLRVPDHDVPRRLAALVGPLATTSANRHGHPAPATAEAAAASLAGPVASVLDGGPCDGAASTVVSTSGLAVRILRQGRLSAAEVRAALT